MPNLQETWETYARSWGKQDKDDRLALYEKSLAPECVYTDPLVETAGWEELSKWMSEFHQQVPGGYFETVHFLAHHSRSIAHWEMKNADGVTLDHGSSYGEYDADGRLVRMIGFYKTPQ